MISALVMLGQPGLWSVEDVILVRGCRIKACRVTVFSRHAVIVARITQRLSASALTQHDAAKVSSAGLGERIGAVVMWLVVQ